MMWRFGFADLMETFKCECGETRLSICHLYDMNTHSREFKNLTSPHQSHHLLLSVPQSGCICLGLLYKRMTQCIESYACYKNSLEAILSPANAE